MPCGLYYKHVMIVNDVSSVVSKWSIKLIDDPSIVIYDRNRFIIQATDCTESIQQNVFLHRVILQNAVAPQVALPAAGKTHFNHFRFRLNLEFKYLIKQNYFGGIKQPESHPSPSQKP